MTLVETIDLAPSSDLAGEWEGRAPLPVDGVAFTPPQVLARKQLSYQNRDADADGTQTGLALPDIGYEIETSEIVPVDTSDYRSGRSTYITNHSISYPADPSKPLQVDDYAFIWTETWSGEVDAPPATPSGYTLRFSFKDSGSPGDEYAPRLTLFYRKLTGSESGSVPLVLPDAAPLNASMEIWRGVDPNVPFDVSTAGPVYGGSNPNPAGITPQSVGCRTIAAVAGRVWGGDSDAQPPDGYTFVTNQSDDKYQQIMTAVQDGYSTENVEEDPGAFVFAGEAFVCATITLRPSPGYGPSLTLLVAAAAADETANGGSFGCSLGGANALQQIQVTGFAPLNFTITLDGQTTSSINTASADAATVQAALEALSNVAPGDVRVEGGPIDTQPMFFEFAANLGLQDIPLMTTSDSANITVTELEAGYPGESFTLQGTVNSARPGGSMEPQISYWTLQTTDYVAGQEITVDFSDHDALKSTGAVLVVLSGVDPSTNIEGEAEVTPGESSNAQLGTFTPVTAGTRALTLFAKALAGSAFYDVATGVSRPVRSTRAASAVADSLTLDALITGPLPTIARDMGSVEWARDHKYCGATIGLRPRQPPTAGLDLFEVLGMDLNSYVDIADAGPELFQVVEFDLDAIPADAIKTAARVTITHEADDEHRVRVVLCGINDDGTIVLAEENSDGFLPLPIGSQAVNETDRWREFSNGDPIDAYDRLGVALISTTAGRDLTSHKIYTVTLNLEYFSGGPRVSSVQGPAVGGDPITWAYESGGGLPQVYHEVMIIAGGSQDPDTAVVGNSWAGAAGTIVYSSGLRPGNSARSLTLTDYPLYSGTNTVAVRAWTRVFGQLVASEWATADFNIAGSPPTPPTMSSQPTFETVMGSVEMTINTPASVSRAFVLRSFDGGSTYEVARGGPFTITPSSTATVWDPCPVMHTEALYRVIVDNGPMTEGSWVQAAAGYTPAPKVWYLQNRLDRGDSVAVDVAEFDLVRPRRSVVAQQSGNAIVATSDRLGAVMEVGIRVITPAQRAALDQVLQVDGVLRLTDTLGRSWWCRPSSDESTRFLRAAPDPTVDVSDIRDAHIVSVQLTEVSG